MPRPDSSVHQSTPSLFTRSLNHRFGGNLLFLSLYLGVAQATRLALLLKSGSVVSWDLSLLAAFFWGLLFDVGAGMLASIPLALALGFAPAGLLQRSWNRWITALIFGVLLFALIFGAVAEWFFWDEFEVRLNFIAVDYLVYTKEVIGNIQESYPMAWIFCGIGALALVGLALFWRSRWTQRWLQSAPEPFRVRLRAAGIWIGVALAFGLLVDSRWLPEFANTYNREIAKNGLWSLFAAFRNNELDYDQFYPTRPIDEAFSALRKELASDHAMAIDGNPRDTLRFIRHEGPELRPNVIQITVESLSADFLSIFNHASALTPNLEAIARKSIVFDRLYATGTRTDRGMEALTLALPPTPGRSLVKRPNNENRFSLGSVFRSRGYDTAFIYGGFGYFDNMNYFFGHNGYRVIDRAAVPSKEITFANIWGACDEDLYRWTMREADDDYAAGKPFHFFVMTTSNHRPYTFPDGRIDLPSKVSGRAGAVKYTDYAIGKFLRDAESKPWFKNTIFVIVADHCASVAGKTALPVQNYHIPLIIYAPGGQIQPGHIGDIMSQVDYPPTLLGLLNWSYATRFYGWDVRTASGDRRALIGNYQKIGLYEKGALSLLMPVKRAEEFTFNDTTFETTPRPAELTDEVIAYYQTASYLYKNRGYETISPEEQARYQKENALLPAPPPKSVAKN